MATEVQLNVLTNCVIEHRSGQRSKNLCWDCSVFKVLLSRKVLLECDEKVVGRMKFVLIKRQRGKTDMTIHYLHNLLCRCDCFSLASTNCCFAHFVSRCYVVKPPLRFTGNWLRPFPH